MIRFSLRDKRLFEIIEVDITRVDCFSESPFTYAHLLAYVYLHISMFAHVSKTYHEILLISKYTYVCICLHISKPTWEKFAYITRNWINWEKLFVWEKKLKILLKEFLFIKSLKGRHCLPCSTKFSRTLYCLPCFYANDVIDLLP